MPACDARAPGVSSCHETTATCDGPSVQAFDNDPTQLSNRAMKTFLLFPEDRRTRSSNPVFGRRAATAGSLRVRLANRLGLCVSLMLLMTAVAFADMLATLALGAEKPPPRSPLDPVGKIHIPIGIADTLDSLKTFVEAEGCFSPGFATYGIYFWVYEPGVPQSAETAAAADSRRLFAPTMPGVKCDRGLTDEGYLIPWIECTGPVRMRIELCHVLRERPAGPVHVVGARVQLAVVPDHKKEKHVQLYAVLRPLGPAGGPVRRLSVSDDGRALLVDGRAALVALQPASGAGVMAEDDVGSLAAKGLLPAERDVRSDAGNCSGALRFDIQLPADGSWRRLDFICPVLPGRRAAGHRWDGVSKWAQLDLAEPNPAEGGVPQPDPGLAYYQALKVEDLFRAATTYWEQLAGRVKLELPDRRWTQCWRAIVGHAALCLNEGAPDVAVINYNVFNRDGVYVANILQKANRPDLAAAAIDYFLRHPFNGRVEVEADNPGQVLWIMGEHWRFTGDRQWLERVYPASAKLAAMIRYYRTTPGPHWVKADSLEFGDALPPDRPDDPPALRRQVLRPGSCDGHHPEYTEAFDIAGLRAAALLASAVGKPQEAAQWEKLATELLARYDERFGKQLPRGYGSYCVLWPCRLYPLSQGKAFEQFRNIGAQKPNGWRYFPLATAHQGLLAGNRAAGCQTIAAHLDHPQMYGWYAFDEGGPSGPGGWRFARTTWNPGVAMPHGWACAEMFLLLRDCLAFEDHDQLILLAGVPEAWLRPEKPWRFAELPTWFGKCSLAVRPVTGGTEIELSCEHAPPEGLRLRLPAQWDVRIAGEGAPARRTPGGDVLIPGRAGKIEIRF